MNWYLEVLKKYAVFNGRARRKEYWMFVLFNNIITFVLVVVEGILGDPSVIVMLYRLAVFIPALAVSVRRLHDTERSGWWLLIGFVPIIGIQMHLFVSFWIGFVPIIGSIVLLVLLVFMVQDSKSGQNKYGTNPKEATAEGEEIMQDLLGVFMGYGIMGYGTLQIVAGYVGIDFHFGAVWAGVAIVAASMFHFTLPITIGAFFGAMDVWGWHWGFAALFAAPGLAFLIPGVILSIIEGVKK